MKTVLFVGNLVEVKAPDRLLRAWPAATARHADARLEIIGRGPLRRKLENLAAQLGIADSVRFIGAVPHEEIADHMRAAHCLALTSRSEGMPNVVLEALACGTPVVATAVGEVPYLIEEDINGYMVASDRVTFHVQRSTFNERTEQNIIEELAEKVGEALEREWDPETVAATVKEFTWEKAAATVIEAIETNTCRTSNVKTVAR